MDDIRYKIIYTINISQETKDNIDFIDEKVREEMKKII